MVILIHGVLILGVVGLGFVVMVAGPETAARLGRCAVRGGFLLLLLIVALNAVVNATVPIVVRWWSALHLRTHPALLVVVVLGHAGLLGLAMRAAWRRHTGAKAVRPLKARTRVTPNIPIGRDHADE
ncbi:MAG: hypothetical protein AB2A00_26790 [Myxococcota bacterium]